MSNEKRIEQRTSRGRWWVLLLVMTLSGVYVGARWHQMFEKWAGSILPADKQDSESNKPDGSSTEKKQLWTCGMHPQVIQDHPGDCPICHMKLTPLVMGNSSDQDGDSTDAAAAGMVRIDPVVVQNMGIRIGEVVEEPLVRRVSATASLTEPETGRVEVNLRVSGWIQKLDADTDGMEVRKNDPLFDLYSPELQLAIEELIAAKKSARVSVEDSNGTIKETSQSLVEAAEQRLRTLGMVAEQIAEFGTLNHAPAVVQYRSPIDGYVLDKMNVYEGSAVMAGQTVLRLADRSTMWVEVRVPEMSIGAVRIGKHANVRIDALPERTFDGEVIFVHPHLDMMTRTGLVRVEITNAGGELRRGMYARVDIDIGEDEPVLIVPREAVIDTGQSQLVMVSLDKGRFEPRYVTLGASGEHGLVQVLSGLERGERVVVSGQFLLDSESRLREAVAKFLDGGIGHQHSAASSLSSSSGVRSTASNVKLPLAAQERLDAVVTEYLAIVEVLGAEQSDDRPLNPQKLISDLQALHNEIHKGEHAGLISAALREAEKLKNQPIDKQREVFKAVSAKVIAVVERMPPSLSVAETIYVVNCPMADADWLQRSTDIANPYYADDMKECGFVVRPIGRGASQPHRGKP